jgi:hypothetical protein
MGVVYYAAFLVDVAVGGHGVVFGGAFELEGCGEEGVDCAGEVDSVIVISMVL